MTLVLRLALACISTLLLTTTVLAGTVTGTVTAADTRQPLSSMVVAAYDESGSLRGTATTDATGLYVLTLPAGTYRVLAYDLTGGYATEFTAGAESFETSPQTVVGATGSVRIDFALQPGGSVRGVVLDPSGNPRPNAVVAAYNLSGTRRGFTTTNAQGTYSMVLPPGEYKLVAFDEGGAFAAAFYREAADFGAATPVRVTARQITTPIDFRLTIAARVVGSVVDATTRMPLAGMAVYAYTESGVLVAVTNSDANGVFRFALPAGRYRFVAADPGRMYATSFHSNRRAFTLADVAQLTVGQLAAVEFALVRAGALAGRVTNASGAAVAGATVAAYNLDGTLQIATTTDANGNYELAVAPGEVKLAAFDFSQTYATQFLTQRNTFAAGERISVVAGTRSAGHDFVLQRGGRIRGTVNDPVTSQVLAGITVVAYDANGGAVAQARTAADGTYTLVVPPGSYRVVAFDDQLRYATRFDGGAGSYETSPERTVAADGLLTVNFGLVRGIRVSGTVTDNAGHAVSGVEIQAFDTAGHRVGGAVAVNGAFTIVLPAQSYTLVASDPSGRFGIARISLTIQPGQTPDLVEFVLSGAGRRRAVGGR